MRYTYTTDDLQGREDICIEDMCGRYSDGYPANYWADWDGVKVTFGGDWREVPDMPTPGGTVNEDQVQAWLEQHTTEAESLNDTSDSQDLSGGRAQGTALPDEYPHPHFL